MSHSVISIRLSRHGPVLSQTSWSHLPQAIQTLRQTHPVPTPLYVTFAPGRYFVEQALSLDCAEYSHLRFCAEEPGTVSIIGAKVIEGWEETVVDGQRRWTVTLPEVAAYEWNFRSLFVEGKRRPRARYPKFDAEKGDLATLSIAAVDAPEGKPVKLDLHAGGTRFKPQDGDIQDWPGLSEAEAVVLHFWVDERLPN